MPRPQFTLRALLVAMLVVAAFCGGTAWRRAEDQKRLRFLEGWRKREGRWLEAHAEASVDETEHLRVRLMSLDPEGAPAFIAREQRAWFHKVYGDPE
jgi:hypothetical protein